MEVEKCFVFISLVYSYRAFISNVVIVIHSCGVFANYVFFNFFLFPLKYVSPIFYIIDWEYHVFAQKRIGLEFLFSPMICTLYHESFCRQDSHRLIPAQAPPFALIFWYVAKIIYLSQEKDQFEITSSNLFFDLIDLILHAFYVR